MMCKLCTSIICFKQFTIPLNQKSIVSKECDNEEYKEGNVLRRQIHDQQCSGKDGERTTELTNPLKSIIVTAGMRHHHAHILFGVVCDGNILVTTLLIFGGNLLNPHLIHFTLFPVGDVVENHCGLPRLVCTYYRGKTTPDGVAVDSC